MNYKILDKIKSQADIKKLTYEELDLLAAEVRDLIIDSISKNGGHLASSLGVVELTIALMLAYEFPKDKIIWDVGHQSYAYKILTDRKEAFESIRAFGGISGFPKRKESPFDSFDTGHSSTSISAGLGMCFARDLNEDTFKVVSVIGDGALTGGMAFEALNNCSDLKSNYVIILNDNEMSISKSSGGISKALLGIRSSSGYFRLKKNLKNSLEKTALGNILKKILIKMINTVKQFITTEGMYFENLNINYVGPIDGHNIRELYEVISTARKSKEPVLVHVKTIKGKGYKFAEDNPTLYHGVGAFDRVKGVITDTKRTYTSVFSNEIIKLASDDKRIVAITAAMSDGTGLTAFAEKFPDRFFDVGIAEQHAVTFAAGLALQKMIPVVCIYSSFLQRAFDQIIHDIALQNLHVVFMIDRAGIVGADGETHQGIFDISYLRMIPNMTVLAPKNDTEFEKMIEYAINGINAPVAIRYPRGSAYTGLKEFDSPIVYGKSEIIVEDKNASVLLFALGSMVEIATKVKEELEHKGIKSSTVNARFAKPIDLSIIDYFATNSSIKKIVVLEENVKNGGMGEEIENYIFDKGYNVAVKLFTLPDAYIEHGDVNTLKSILHLDAEGIFSDIYDEK